MWWTRIHERRNEFQGIAVYRDWIARGILRPNEGDPAPNWVSLLVFREEASEPFEWEAAKRDEGTLVEPVMAQSTGPYTLVWFNHGFAVLEATYLKIARRVDAPAFTVHEELDQLKVWDGDTLVAMAAASPVPNRSAACAALHELALRRAVSLEAEELRELVADHLRPVQYCAGAKLTRAVCRLLRALEDTHDLACPSFSSGITEWSECRAISHEPEGIFFRRTSVPVGALFGGFARGKTVEQFLGANPSVTPEQVASVLEHLVCTLAL